MMVPMIEVRDMIIKTKMVSLSEIKNDHNSFRNEFFNGVSFNDD